jgi:molecular chaperone GrpE
MVKKKITETGETKDTNEAETAEYKDHTNNIASDSEDKQEQIREEGISEKLSGSVTTEGPASDKKLPDDESFEEKLAEMQDRYLRLTAEFDNYRKRTLKEKMEISKYAGEELLKNILPFMDDFERAAKHLETASDFKGIKEGIELIYNKLSDFLKQQGIKEIESLNTDFDVDLHDAVAKTPVAEDDKKGKIVEVLSKGYYLKDKVIRHSKVVIGE